MADEVCTLIGDLVHSREAADRAALHARLAALLDQVNEACVPVTPLRITVGDEYQGAFASVASAARAALLMRVGLRPDHDARQGLGWGRVSVLQDEPRVEDGPGWWAARDAVHAVEAAEERPSTSRRRTAYRLAEGADGPEEAWVEPLLVLRDEIVGGLSGRSLSVLRGLLTGHTQRDIAEELGITPSAVSQRVRSHGLGSVLIAEEMMRGGR